MRITPAAARKLVEGAVAYAQSLGFAPVPDFKKASRVLGGTAVNPTIDNLALTVSAWLILLASSGH